MSFAAYEWARKARTGSPGAKAILQAVANYADERNECYPSIATLAYDTEQSADTVRRRLRDLEAKGLIERVDRHRDNGTRTTDLIRLLINDAAQNAVPPMPEKEGGDPSKLQGYTLANCEGDPSTGARGTLATVRGHNNFQSNFHSNPPLPPEGDGARADEKSDGAEGATPQAGPAVGGDTQLDELMAAFAADASVVLARPEAARVWSRLSAADRACALARLPRYLDHCAKHKNKIRAPASYLRGRVWEQFDVVARPTPPIERGEADAVCRAVAWAESSGSDRSGWPFVAEGTAEWDLWAAAYRHAGRAFAVGRRALAPDGNGGFAHRLGRFFPIFRPPALHDPPQAGEAAE